MLAGSSVSRFAGATAQHGALTPNRTTHERGRQEIEEQGIGAIDFVRKAGGGCLSYGTKYSVGMVLTMIASVNVVIINFGLKASVQEGPP